MDDGQIDITLRSHSAQLADHGRRLTNLEAREFVIGDLVSPFLGLPALRGLWTAGSVNEAGGMIDLSGQGRTLGYNGAPQLIIHNNLVPAFTYNGAADFHSRPSEAGLSITGIETINTVVLRGLTLGGWFWSNLGGTAQGLIGKRTAAGNQRSYLLETGAGPTLSFLVSTDGINDVSVAGPSIPTAGWFFAVGRFTPSTELKAFVNGASVVNTTAIPASIFVSTSAFQVAAFNAGANLLAGRCALGFLSSAVLPDTFIQYLFARTRPFFQVSPQ